MELLFFGVRLQLLLGLKGMSILYGYVGAGALLIKFFLPDYKKMRREEKAVEGRFKFVHQCVKTHAESIAFFGGDQAERDVVEREAFKMWRLTRDRLVQTLLFGIPNQFF